MSVSSLFSPNTFGLNCNELVVAGELQAGSLAFESATVSGGLTVEGTTTLNGALNVTSALATFSQGATVTGDNLRVFTTANMENVDAANLRSNGTLTVYQETSLNGRVFASVLTFDDTQQQVVASNTGSGGQLCLKDLGETFFASTFTWITLGQAQPTECVMNAIRSGTFCMCTLLVRSVTTTAGGTYEATITLPYGLTNPFIGADYELIGTLTFSDNTFINGGGIISLADTQMAHVVFTTAAAVVTPVNMYASFIYSGLAVGPPA